MPFLLRDCEGKKGPRDNLETMAGLRYAVPF